MSSNSSLVLNVGFSNSNESKSNNSLSYFASINGVFLCAVVKALFRFFITSIFDKSDFIPGLIAS